MSTTAPEATVEAYSKRDKDGNDLLGNCLLVVGDGTMKAEFKNGRAEIPASLAYLFAKHPHVMIPGLGDLPAAATEAQIFAAQAAPAATVTAEAGITGPAGELIKAMELRIAELEAALAAQAKQAIAPAEATAPSADSDEAKAEALRLAAEYLEAEGEDVPEPEAPNPEVAKSEVARTMGPVSRAGSNVELAATTADNQARCQALKGDGTQCANPAREGQACQLAKHREQLAPTTD